MGMRIVVLREFLANLSGSHARHGISIGVVVGRAAEYENAQRALFNLRVRTVFESFFDYIA